MKTRNAIPTLCLCLLFTPAVIADQTIPGSLTVQQGLLIQQDTWLYGATSFGHLTENPQLPGLWLSLAQDETNTMQTNVITPGYWIYKNVVVEDYGMVDNGHLETTYSEVVVNDYYPAVYDSEGNLVTEAYTAFHMER